MNTKQNIVNNVNGIGNVVTDVAFGSGRSCAASKVIIKRNPHKERVMRIGTWNVRTMGGEEKVRREKMGNAVIEMKRTKLNILGLSEVKWKKSGDCYFEGYRFISVGGGRGQRGVAIVLDPETAQRVTNVVQDCGDRIVKVKIEAEPRNLVVIQVYMPTSDSEEEEIEEMYEKLENLMGTEKANEELVVMGDWNAVVGEGNDGNDGKEMGRYGLGKRNERGERLIEFCRKNQLVVTNTCFQQHRRRRYTWRSPGDISRYQLDYIIVRQRYKKSVKSSHSYPGADIGSDHNMVMMSLAELKLKRIQRPKRKRRLDLEELNKKPDMFSS